MMTLDQSSRNLKAEEQTLIGQVLARTQVAYSNKVQGPVPLFSEDEVYLPECVEILPTRDGELPRFVLIDAVVQHLPLVQQAQGIRPVVPGPDPGREETAHHHHSYRLEGRSALGRQPATASQPRGQGVKDFVPRETQPTAQ